MYIHVCTHTGIYMHAHTCNRYEHYVCMCVCVCTQSLTRTYAGTHNIYI